MSERNSSADRRPLQARWQFYDLAAFVRYGVVGVLQNAVFYGLGLALIYMHFTAWQATLVTYPIAVTFSFAANRLWSFAGRKRTAVEFRKYVVVYAVAYPIAVFMTWAQEQAGVPPWLASLFTLVMAAVGIFLVLNLWVFGKAVNTKRNSSHQS